MTKLHLHEESTGSLNEHDEEEAEDKAEIPAHVLSLVRGLFPLATSFRSTGEKGLINTLVIVDGAHIVKIAGKGVDDRDRLRFELEDLARLSEAGISTPSILDVGTTYFSMPLLPQERVNWKLLTRTLEKLHGHVSPNGMFGFHRDSFYGKRRLKNDWSSDWWDFFVSTRLEPTLKDLEKQGEVGLAGAGRLIGELGRRFLEPPSEACLLHGDVFANNVLHDGKSETVLIDPVCFFGDFLMDFAKFGSKKYSGRPRARIYKVYYSLDFFLFTGRDREVCETNIKKALKMFQGSPQRWPNTLVRHEPQLQSEGVGLLYFGAFNPPHPNHLRMLCVAKDALADEHNISVGIGMFVPSPDTYLAVPRKQTSEARRLPLKTREGLLYSNGCIDDRAGWGVWTFVVNHATTIHAAVETFRLNETARLSNWMIVCGSDTAIQACDPVKQGIPSNVGVVVVERTGYPVSLELLEGWRQLRSGAVLLVGQQEEEEWSSTKVREDAELWEQYSQQIGR